MTWTHSLRMMHHARALQAQFVDPTRETPIRWHGTITEPVDDPRGRLTASLDRVDFTLRHAPPRR